MRKLLVEIAAQPFELLRIAEILGADDLIEFGGEGPVIRTARLVAIVPRAPRLGRGLRIAHLGIVGHVGDGNYHVAFLLDPDDAASIAQAEALNARLVEDALARGGTCTGEHGIGFGKLGYLEHEHGDLLPLMRGIKALLDPNGILNPGKVLPPEVLRTSAG